MPVKSVPRARLVAATLVAMGAFITALLVAVRTPSPAPAVPEVAGTATGVLPTPVPGYPTRPRGIAFTERFSGPAVPTDLFNVLDGYAYGESWYAKEKSSVQNGILSLVSDSRDRTRANLIRIGGVQSLAFYGYGRFTIRAKANPARGIVSEFYLYNEDRPTAEGGRHEEVHLLLSAKEPGKASLVTYHNDNWQNEGLQNAMRRGGIKNLRAIPGLERFDGRQWNTYVIDWRPHRVTWTVNGIKAEEFTQAVPTTPMYFAFDVQHTSTWPAFVDPVPAGAGTFEVDSVSYQPF